MMSQSTSNQSSKECNASKQMPYRIELPKATLKSVPKQDIVQNIRSSHGSSIDNVDSPTPSLFVLVGTPKIHEFLI
jgi:hypothetical protein